MGLEARLPPAEPDAEQIVNAHHESPPSSALPASLWPALPPLVASPTAFSGSCLALSTRLVAFLQTLLPPPPAVALSIGSGFGLLEAYLGTTGQHSPWVVGVEVEPSPNKYLPASHHRLVHGTRFLAPLAAEAAAWLFVYPRRVGLVQEYMAEHGGGRVERVVWAGPKADWDDYKPCFAGWHVEEHEADHVGGRAWELIAVASKALA
ncbi:hypothetical protein DDE82_004631 [Stemphylium lycopersici]|nr:hypothetical protein TW65_07805 [Stemphylium lycopersici]RAR04192.1 hypothetical protein DDE82_004631 [Stemphylium lycopersici]